MNMTEWQPIETAPKDGTPILVVRAEEGEIEITRFCVIQHAHYEEAEGGLYRRVEDEPYKFWDGNGHRATHWMPLPPPPVIHKSDCAVNNGPALPPGPCNCGAIERS